MDRTPLRTSLLRPRHLLATAFVALLTGAAGIGVAAAAGPEEAPPSAWDEPFAVPLPRVGDHGRYVHEGGHDQRDDGYWPDDVEFRWLADGKALNETGSSVLVNRLWVREGERGGLSPVLDLWPGTTLQVGYRMEDNQTSMAAGGSPLEPDRTSTDRIASTWFEDRLATMWCGIRNPLQGLAVDLRQPLPDPTSCWNGPRSWAVDEYVVVAKEVGGQAPGRTAVVEGLMAPGGTVQERPFLRAHYREGFAYPVRVEFLAGDAGNTYAAAYVLDGFEAGSVPIASEGRVLAGPPTPVTIAPRAGHGPDEAGVEHPFPLSEAWATAQADPQNAGFAEYLADHPDAYVGQARYQEILSNGRPQRHWYVVATDGERQFGFRVIQHPALDQAPVPQVARYTYDRLTDGWEEGPYPAPDKAPAAVPTVASVMRAWSELTGEEGANAWSFDLRCRPSEGDPCAFDDASVGAGRAYDEMSGVPTIAMERATEETFLHVRLDGTLAHHSRRTSTDGYGLTPVDPPAGTPPGEEPEPADLKPLPEPPAAWVPTPKEAAAIGGLAALATLLYWLWPAAKGAPALGLFSRVQKDRLLENPLRAQLVQRIEAEPGIHHNALVRDLGRGKGSAEHHLDKLVQGRLVLRSRGTGYTCYFPAGTDRRAMAASPALKADGARRVLEAVRAGPKGVRALAAETGLAPSTVSHHLQRLQAAGLVAGGPAGYHAVQAPYGTGAGAAA